MRGVGSVENALPPLQESAGAAEVNVSWSEKRERAVAMLRVIPFDERAAERSCLCDIGKRRGKFRLVLGSFEERFDVRVVIGNMRAGMALGYTEIGEQERDWFRSHRATAICMYGELLGIYAFFLDRFGEQHACQRGALTIGDHPADDVATIDVDDDVEVKIRPLLRTMQFGDIPGKNLARRGCAQFRLHVRRTRGLIASLADFPGAVKNPIHRGQRAMIDAFVQERCVNIGHAAIDESMLVNRVQDCFVLSGVQS